MLGHSPVPNRGYGTSSSTNEAGGLEHAAAGKVWTQTCSVVIRVRGAVDAWRSDTFVHGTCSFCLRRHMAPLSQGTARACLSGPTAAHRHDRHSLQEAAPEHQRERPKVVWPRSCELSIPSRLHRHSVSMHTQMFGYRCTAQVLRSRLHNTCFFVMEAAPLRATGGNNASNECTEEKRIASHTCFEFGNASKSHVSSNWMVLLEKMWSKWLT